MQTNEYTVSGKLFKVIRIFKNFYNNYNEKRAIVHWGKERCLTIRSLFD